MKKLTALFVMVFAVGCADVGPPPQSPRPDYAKEGIAPHVWEEPMVDVVDVPPGLDPEGHYYRPAHKSVVEIRQGKWQHYKEKE